MTAIYKHLGCSDLHMGFARDRCEECGHDTDLLSLASVANFAHLVIRKEALNM